MHLPGSGQQVFREAVYLVDTGMLGSEAELFRRDDVFGHNGGLKTCKEYTFVYLAHSAEKANRAIAGWGCARFVRLVNAYNNYLFPLIWE